MTELANHPPMRVAVVDPNKTRQLFKTTRLSKTTKRVFKRVVLLALPVVFFPKTFAFLVLCGLLDVARHRRPNLALLEHYFLGNGVLTWLLSPFNLLMDLFTLPYRNRGIYQLTDLPASHQAEIKSVIEAAEQSDLVERLKERVTDRSRTMIFFKWYGKNIETSIDVPAFHRRYQHIRTIGVSVFNKRQSTSEHFGPLRVTLRMLYNINPIKDRNAYIQVGDQVHRWCDNRLFIFDDTLQHKSCNETDEVRYCMFVDMLRPSPVPYLTSAVLHGLRLVLLRFNSVFYKHWRVVR
jgi:aspartyl/asparaginyl beta-hydroxylase (cupin superfamily)